MTIIEAIAARTTDKNGITRESWTTPTLSTRNQLNDSYESKSAKRRCGGVPERDKVLDALITVLFYVLGGATGLIILRAIAG